MSAARPLPVAPPTAFAYSRMMTDAALADAYVLLAESQGPAAVIRAEREIALYHAGQESRFSTYAAVKRAGYDEGAYL